MKVCKKCQVEKELTEFYLDRGKPRASCKICFYISQDKKKKLATQKRYASKNKDERNAYNAKYYAANRDSLKQYQKEYKANNKDKCIQWARDSHNKRKDTPTYKILKTCRSRIFFALKNKAKKAKKTVDLIGCSIDELMSHLERQFTEGMTWDNYGKWHVDHILPCASFDLTNPEQQRKCFHFTNLQPLWALDNLRKGDSL